MRGECGSRGASSHCSYRSKEQTGRRAQGVHPPAEPTPSTAASAAPKPPLWAGISTLSISISSFGLTFPWRVIASLP